MGISLRAVFSFGIAIFAIFYALDYSGKVPWIENLSGYWQRPLSKEKVPPLTPIYNILGFYVVDLSVGTPSRTFKALLDLGFQDLIVPSAQCLKNGPDEGFCDDATILYDISNSSTGVNLNRPIERQNFRELVFSGDRVVDKVTIGGLEVKDQIFHSASEASTDNFGYYPYDAVLGLDRYPFDKDHTVDWKTRVLEPSPWQNVIKRKLLEKNLFSLILPRHELESGLLEFGKINPNFAPHLVSIPLVSVPGNVAKNLPSDWIVRATSIGYGDHYEENDYLVSFDTADPHIRLPEKLLQDVLKAIGSDLEDLTLPCDKRNSMPNLKFKFGPQSTEFVLSPHQYVQEELDENEEIEGCWLPLLPSYDGDDATDLEGRLPVTLGSTFLRAMYSVFDVDSQTVSLAPRKVSFEESH